MTEEIKTKYYQQITDFITSYLMEHLTTDATDETFHEEFFNRFGGKRNQTFYGAQMVYKAQYWLKRLTDEGILIRSRFGISDVPEGYPKWVWVYSLKDSI